MITVKSTRLDLLSIPQKGGKKCQNAQVGSEAANTVVVKRKYVPLFTSYNIVTLTFLVKKTKISYDI